MSGPHLIWMRVHHLLADAVQLCGVANEAQIFLLDDLAGRLLRRLPHLLENLRDTGGNRWEPLGGRNQPVGVFS